MKITVDIDVPPGKSCFEAGRFCPHFNFLGECKIFNDTPKYTDDGLSVEKVDECKRKVGIIK